jgi:hypothetical protein
VCRFSIVSRKRLTGEKQIVNSMPGAPWNDRTPSTVQDLNVSQQPASDLWDITSAAGEGGITHLFGCSMKSALCFQSPRETFFGRPLYLGETLKSLPSVSYSLRRTNFSPRALTHSMLGCEGKVDGGGG